MVYNNACSVEIDTRVITACSHGRIEMTKLVGNVWKLLGRIIMSLIPARGKKYRAEGGNFLISDDYLLDGRRKVRLLKNSLLCTSTGEAFVLSVRGVDLWFLSKTFVSVWLLRVLSGHRTYQDSSCILDKLDVYKEQSCGGFADVIRRFMKHPRNKLTSIPFAFNFYTGKCFALWQSVVHRREFPNEKRTQRSREQKLGLPGKVLSVF